jgi:hypothetical protein
VDEARALVAGAFCRHQLLPIDESRSVDTRFHSVRFGNVGLSYLDYGAPVRVAPDEFHNFFLVLLALKGTAEIVCGRDRIVSDPSVRPCPSRTSGSRCAGARVPAQIALAANALPDSVSVVASLARSLAPSSSASAADRRAASREAASGDPTNERVAVISLSKLSLPCS